MHSSCPGRLRPWVWLACAQQVLTGRPDPAFPSSEWAHVLWNFALRKDPSAVRPHLTALRWSTEPWLENPPSGWFSWTERARRRVWPVGLLWEMARGNCSMPLEHPTPNLPTYVGELATLAAAWYGPELGATVWNSLALSSSDIERRSRWRLALEHPEALIRPPAGTPLERLEEVADILQTCRSKFAHLWPLLFEAEELAYWTEDAWQADLTPTSLLHVTTLQPSCFDDVLQHAPELVDMCLHWRAYAEFLPSNYPELFRHKHNLSRRLLLLATLHQLDSAEPHPLLLELARQHPDGGHILQAHTDWLGHAAESDELRQAAHALQVCSDKLRRLVHLRALSGHRRTWPKPVRGWLGQRVTTQEHDIRQLLRVQLALEGSLREAAREAWQRLLREAAQRLFAEFCGVAAVRPEQLPAAWLLANSCTNPDLVSELLSDVPLAQRPANRAWQAPPQLRMDAWLAPVRIALGADLWLETASLLETLQMGSDFQTCLSLEDGCYSHSVVINALDLNKKVLYVRNSRQRPLLRILLAVNQQGRLVAYPVYGSASKDVQRQLMHHVAEHARQCGLTLANDEGDVLQLHSQSNYYADIPQPAMRLTAEPFADDDDFCRLPTRPDQASAWAVARSFHCLHRTGSDGPLEHEAAEWLGFVGSTDWLHNCKHQVWANYLECLDYAADPVPLARHFLRTRARSRSRHLPVALVALPFAQLVAVLTTLLKARSRLWPGPGLAHQAFVLLHISWLRGPDHQSLWRHLRRRNFLEPVLWWLVSHIDAPQLRCLMRSPDQLRRAAGSFAWAAGRQGCLLDTFRQQLLERGYSPHCAAALARSPHPEDHQFARKHLTRPLVFTEMQRYLVNELHGNSDGRLGPVPQSQCPLQWADRDPWRLQLLARLYLDAQHPHLSGPALQQSLYRTCPDTTAAFDLNHQHGRRLAYPYESSTLIRLLERPQSRPHVWEHIRALSPGERFDLILNALHRSHPEDWQLLTRWTPQPSSLVPGQWERAEQLARTSRRLSAWLAKLAASESPPPTGLGGDNANLSR